jgi:hypothetical protein
VRGYLKRATPYILGLLLFCLVVWLIGSSQLFQSCISEGEDHARDQALQNKVPIFISEFWVYRRCLGAYVIERNAGITALFTVVLAASTILLWIVTNKAAEAAKVAAEYIPMVEGAHVYVVMKVDNVQHQIRAIATTPTLPMGFTAKIDVALKNFGKTPAFIERFTARLLVVSAKKPISGPEANIQPNTIIGTGEETKLLTVSASPLSKTDAEEIWRCAAALVLAGTLIYRDILGVEWTVPFDGRFDNEAGRFRIDNQPRQKNA